MITSIRRITIGVTDLNAALGFFAEGLGLPLSREVALKQQPHAWEMGFDPQATGLAILEETAGHPSSQPGRITIELETDDIEADYQALQAKGVAFDGPPVEQEWAGKVAYFKGPDGTRLALVQPS